MTTASTKTAFLGIDGGGTQTQCLLVDSSGQLLAHALGGSANIRQMTCEELHVNLETLIQRTLTQTNTTVKIHAACVGLAGASSEEAQIQIRSALNRLTLQPTLGYLLKTDAEIALSGAYVNQPGNILIAGTGSICYGRAQDGSLHRTGGYGPTFDDAGSGSWIGRAAIRIAIQQEDTRLPGAKILNCVKHHFAGSSLSTILNGIQNNRISNQEIARLSPQIFALAEADDALAKDILQQASEALYEMVSTTARKTGVDSIALFGGILHAGSLVRETLTQKLSEIEHPIRIEAPSLNALGGALIEAYEHSQEADLQGFLKKLRSLNGTKVCTA